MARRKRSKIDRLDPEFKASVEEVIVSNQFSYAKIAEFIRDNTGQTISKQAVCTHAKGLCESLATLRMAQENFKIVMQELNRYPDMNSTEGIIQLMAYKLFTSVEQVTSDDLKNTDPLKLMKQASELVRVAAYKRNLDLKNKDIEVAGFDAVKDKFFKGLAVDNPMLYKQLSEYVDKKKSELEGGGSP